MQKKRIYQFLKWTVGIIAVFVLSITAMLYVYKDDICKIAITQVNKYLKTKVSVGEVDLTFWGSFPNLSIDFNQVFIQDSYAESTELDTLLFSERIRCKFDPMDIWNENYNVKTIELSPGTIQLKVDEEGDVNYDIIKSSSDSVQQGDPFELNLSSIVCEGIRFSYTNKATDQEYRTSIKQVALSGELSTGNFSAKAESDMTIIRARSGNVSLVRNQPARLSVGVNVNSDSATVTIPASTIYIANLPFNFNAEFDTTGFNFDLNANNIKIDDAANKLALSQTKNVKHFNGNGKLIFDLNVKGKNKSTAPVEVLCDFGVKNGRLSDPNTGVTLSDLNLIGKYSNIGGKDKEALDLNNISFRTKGGVFSGNLRLTHFEQPVYEGNANGLINLAILQSLVRVQSIDYLTGSVDVNTDFKIQSTPLESGGSNLAIEKCSGKMKLNQVALKLVNDKREFKNIEGQTYLRNNEVGLDNISLKIGSSDFSVNGVFKHISEYFSDQGSLIADVDLTCKNVNLSDLGSDSKEEHIQQSRTFMLPNNIDGRVFLDVNKLNYESHTFHRLKGNMIVNHRSIHFPRLTVTNGGADVAGTLTIEERKPEIFYLSSQMVSKNISFKSLFAEWNNFRQDVITSKNISGVAQANVTFEAPFDLRSGIISDAIVAQIGLTIKNGRLRNVETFKSITQSLKETSSARLAIGKENINAFEKKLLDLKFSELHNTLVIKNSVMTIPTMSIKSNALDLEASGKHTFDNKIDYRFGFRFRDLKQKEVSEFGEIEDDGTGKFVFMRMYGSLDNPKIEWDKATAREKRKEYNDQEKETAKSILKSEFGLFKNDTTVKVYIQEKRQHEILEVEFNPVDKIDTLIENAQPKKDTKTRRLLNKWKTESEESKKEEFVWD